jgi:hypothetical protein
MTEDEWLHSVDPTPMLQFAASEASDWKLQLVACAFQRRLAHAHGGDTFWMETADELEPYADGRLDRSEPSAYLRDSDPVDVAIILLRDASKSSARLGLVDGPAEERAQAVLVRCVLGNPFRPVAVNHQWRTADTVGLAAAIYQERAFDRLPLLADALMDAGCSDAQLLSHCRSEGRHARGCHVVDLVLGKEWSAVGR